MSMPLLCKVDSLDSIVESMERKGKKSSPLLKHQSRHTPSVVKMDKECVSMSMNMAAPKIHCMASLQERIASLENRLFQLCLEIESHKTQICDPNVGTSLASTDHISISESFRSYPTFSYAKPEATRHQPHVPIHVSELQEKYQRMHEKIKLQKTKQQKIGKDRDAKTCKRAKKSLLPSWPHLKMLGC